MKKLLTGLAILVLLISNLSTLMFAQTGSTYQLMYSTFFDSGVGSGSTYQINSISHPEVEGGGFTFGTTSILSDVGGDGVIDGSENCLEGETMACTSIPNSNWVSGTATCVLDNWSTVNCVPPPPVGGQQSSSPSSSPAPAPTHQAAVEEEEEAEEETAVCGNAIMEGDEECDDGNLEDGDGCSSICTLEKLLDGVVLTFKVYPEKRLPSSGNWANIYTVNIYVRGTRDLILSGQLTTNNAGMGQIITDKIPRGKYDIALKGMSHLRIMATDMLIEEDKIIDVTHKIIRAGDLQGDNFVNALDISKLLSMLYTAQLLADLNRDGIVNALDISIMLGNLYRAGE